MQKKYVISIVGKTCAGKETFGIILQEELGPDIEVVFRRFSDPLNEMLAAIRISQSRPNQQVLSTFIRKEWGEHVLGNALKMWVEEVDAKIIYVDGVRRPADVDMIRRLPNNFLVAIDAPAKSRFERLKKRADRPGDAEKTWEEFQKEQMAEPEQKIAEIAKQADVFIDNSGSFDNLRKQIKKFIVENLKLV